MDMARYYHAGQMRQGHDGQVPYYEEHILGVYGILKDECHIDDEEVLIIALLHDTVEDTACTLEDIEVDTEESEPVIYRYTQSAS